MQKTESNDQNLPIIAIVGATTSGKTSVFTFLYEELPRYGVKPFFVREAATDLFAGGIKLNEIEGVQELIMRRILSEENLFLQAAKNYHGELRPVVICDRGISDARPYCKPGEFETNTQHLGYTHHQLLERYTAVIQLTTLALDAPEIFERVFHENPFRIEGASAQGTHVMEMARTAAIKSHHEIAAAYLGSLKYKSIPNTKGFEEKKRAVLKTILATMGIPVPQEIESKFLVPGFFSREDIPVPHHTVNLTQYYLKNSPELGNMNYPKDAVAVSERVRIRQYDNDQTFIYTVKATVPNDPDPYELEVKISERQFVQLIRFASGAPINKDRTYFIYQNQYFEFDQFHQPIDAAKNNILEIELSEKSDRIILPDFIPNLKDVTGDHFYKNESLAKRLVAQ